MVEAEHEYLDTDTVVCAARSALGIDTPNAYLSDDEIREICRWVGENAPDTIEVDGKKIIRRMGISAMLFIALTEFPEYYERYELAPFG